MLDRPLYTQPLPFDHILAILNLVSSLHVPWEIMIPKILPVKATMTTVRLWYNRLPLLASIVIEAWLITYGAVTKPRVPMEQLPWVIYSVRTSIKVTNKALLSSYTIIPLLQNKLLVKYSFVQMGNPQQLDK